MINQDNKKLSEYMISNLKKFRSTISLQKATVSFLTNQISFDEEIKKEEFDKIDVNKDGKISKDELVKCLEVLYPSQEAKNRANDFFNEIDFNNDEV